MREGKSGRPVASGPRPRPPAVGEASRQPDNGIVIRLQNDPDPERLRLLGDMLVRSLALDTGPIIIRIQGSWRPSPEAAGLFNSLGRHMAREGRNNTIRLCGDGPAHDALMRAYRQGLVRPRPTRRG